MKKRLQKKYQPRLQALMELEQLVPMTKRRYQMVKRITNRRFKPSFIMHEDDFVPTIPFYYHQPGQKYHAEDCNRNNPNHPTYYRKKRKRNKAFRHP